MSASNEGGVVFTEHYINSLIDSLPRDQIPAKSRKFEAYMDRKCTMLFNEQSTKCKFRQYSHSIYNI